MTDILDLDIVQFFTRVTKHPPTEFQKELLISFMDKRISKICICAARQTGKTLCCAVATIWLSLHGKESILLASAQENWIYSHIRDIFTNNPELKDYIIAEGVYSLVPLKGYETKTGTRVHVRGSTEKSIRGIAATIVFCDEAELMTDETLQTALGAVSGEYKYCLLGTPPRERKGLFYEIIKAPNEHGFRLFNWSAEECSWHSKELLASKKKMLKQWYIPEVQGRILEETERGIVSVKDIDACIHDVMYPESGTKEIGLDWGSGHRCFTVLTLIERTKSAHVRVLFTKSWNSTIIYNIFNEIAAILREQKPDKIKADALPEGYIEDLKSIYKGRTIYPVKFGDMYQGATHKERMLGQLVHKIQTHALEIPVLEKELIQQLKTYKRGKQYSDDFVDSLCLALYEDKELFKPATHGIVVFPKDYKLEKNYPEHQHPFIITPTRYYSTNCKECHKAIDVKTDPRTGTKDYYCEECFSRLKKEGKI